MAEEFAAMIEAAIANADDGLWRSIYLHVLGTTAAGGPLR
jgi:hypothetical protein